MYRQSFLALAASIVAMGCIRTASADLSFQGLGDLPGGEFFSMAHGISDDGSTVVGYSYSASWGCEAFRWTRSGGMVGLGYLEGGSNISLAEAVSADGSVIVGHSSSAKSGGGYEAFRWENGQMTGLGDLPGGRYYSLARDVSADGSVIVGVSESAKSGNGYEAFRWESSMTGLGIAEGHRTSEAFAVSNDGHSIVGRSDNQYGFIWRDGEMIPLNTWPDTIDVMDPRDISPDGSVVVGRFTSTVPPRQEAFLLQDGEITPLGMRNSVAHAVSGDGQTVVGIAPSLSGQQACIWTPELGMVSLQSLLEAEYGLDLSGWILMDATGVSMDGLTIVGQGFNPSGYHEGWIATLPESAVIPAPGAALLGVIGLAYSGWRLRRRQ